MKKIFTGLFLLGMCAGCIRQKQVWLGGLQRTHAVGITHNIQRVYFDKWGNLYPELSMLIPYKAFFDPEKTGNTYRNNEKSGNLEAFYRIRPNSLKKLAECYSLGSAYPDAVDSFYAIQQRIFDAQANALKRMLNQSPDQQLLVVFVHGFNDPDPTGDYQQVRYKLETLGYANENTVYLEVYWDGLTANQSPPEFAGIWGRAQHNSAYVGLGLRHLLQKLDSEKLNVRIITHSLGASVGTTALFNVVTKWDPKAFHRHHFKHWDYFDSVKIVATADKSNIRLGMIAPAIPGGSTFCDFAVRGNHTVTPQTNNIDKVIVGYNVNDYAVTKRFLHSDYLCDKFGSTALGCDLARNDSTEIQRTIAALHRIGFDNIIDSTNFSKEKRYEDSEEHGLYYYVRNPKADEFFGKLFE